jgi:SNF2 family DNA or RNA helicase
MTVALWEVQQRALDKMEGQSGFLLYDALGLGKTVTGLARIKEAFKFAYVPVEDVYGNGDLVARGKLLIITQKSIRGQWERWIPEILADHEVRIINYAELLQRTRKPCTACNETGVVWEAEYTVQETCRACKGKGWRGFNVGPNQDLIKWKPDAIIVDEAHRIKNRKAAWTKALKQIKSAKLRIALTGTPIINQPAELWSILNWLYPKAFTSYWKFYNLYVEEEHHEISKVDVCPLCGSWHQREFRVITGAKNTVHLRQTIREFSMRRLKLNCTSEDCIAWLYAGDNKYKLGLPKSAFVEPHDHVKDLPDVLPAKVYEVELEPKQRRAYEEMKAKALAWVGTYDDEPLPAPIAIAQLTRLRQFASAYMEVSDNGYAMREPSSKLDALMDILESTDQPIVVFSMFRQMVDLACARFNEKSIPYFRLAGDTPTVQRNDWQRFQAGERRVFIAQMQAGGAGIDLFRASTIVFLDRSFSPADNEQAIGRLFRAGQKNAVLPIYIQARGTVDEAIETTLQFKASMIKKVLGG